MCRDFFAFRARRLVLVDFAMGVPRLLAGAEAGATPPEAVHQRAAERAQSLSRTPNGNAKAPTHAASATWPTSSRTSHGWFAISPLANVMSPPRKKIATTKRRMREGAVSRVRVLYPSAKPIPQAASSPIGHLPPPHRLRFYQK